MKTKLTFILLLGMNLQLIQAQWSIDSVNTPDTYPYAAVNGNKAVFSNGSEWNTFDPISGMHTNGSFTISRQMIEVVSLGDKVLFGGGKYGSFADPLYTKQVNVYNSTSDSWSIWNLGTAREVGAAAGIGNKVVFAGGTGRTDIAGPVKMYNKVDIFDITTGARLSGKISKARTNIAAGAAGNKIVFAGGWYWNGSYSIVFSNKADIYDVTTGLWSSVLLSKKRDNISVAVVGDQIIFAGGSGTAGAVNTVDIYHASTNTWTVSSMPAAGYGYKTAVIGTDAYFTGYAFGDFDAVYRYNTLTGVWNTFYLPTSLSNFSLSTVDGRLVFAGGTVPGTNTYSDLVQIFDPLTDSWSYENLSMARTNVTALNIGNVSYFAGGIQAYAYPSPVPSNRVDIFAAPFRHADPGTEMQHWAIHIYPNPADQFILINLENQDGIPLPLDLKIVDLQGRQVVRTELYDHQTRIAVDHLAPGVYFILTEDRYGHAENTEMIKQ
ncbi:MAG TPA: T9SS type A sorting domain-containing protein [Chitinophagales bacterium]|nr:T9SS type A sorting domain-containing protein [Chitinophagales bacterium]